VLPQIYFSRNIRVTGEVLSAIINKIRAGRLDELLQKYSRKEESKLNVFYSVA
jgi:hypothetical protein